jgi:hypothetical protein
MSPRTNPLQTDQHPTAQVASGRIALWTGKWSVGRRVALFLFGLYLQFIHAIFFRMMLVPGYEWWDTIEPRLFLLSEALALAANFGFLALPFLNRHSPYARC